MNQRVCRLQGFGESLEPRFLFYGINAHLTAIQEVTGYTTVKHLSSNQILAIEMLIPPRGEQQRIVAILDHAFAAIATGTVNAEQNLRNAQELAQSRIDSVFAQGRQTWAESPLERVADIVNGYAFKSTDFGAVPGIKSIKITNVGVRQFVADAGNDLPAHFDHDYAGSSARAGSIVLALTRTIIAGGLKVAVVPQAYDGALVNQRVAAITPHAAMLSTPFLFLFLSTQRVAQYVKDRVNTLMQPNLSIADLRALSVPIPALSVQHALMKQLAEFQDQALRLERVYQRKLAALDDLKKSLLHQAFTGAL